MDLSNLESRQIAIIVSRGRCVIGLLCIFVPRLVVRLLIGRSDPFVRALTRLVGVRDLVLGVGALTSLKEHDHDAEWLSMGAACDGFDALVFVASPGLPLRLRVAGVAAGAQGAYLMKLSREFAAEREAEAPSATD